MDNDEVLHALADERDRLRAALVRLVGTDDPEVLEGMAALMRMAPNDEDAINSLFAIELLREKWTRG